jgi:hypothetical protein
MVLPEFDTVEGCTSNKCLILGMPQPCRPYLPHKVPCFLGDIINVLSNYTQEIPLLTKYLQIKVKFKIQLNNNFLLFVKI